MRLKIVTSFLRIPQIPDFGEQTLAIRFRVGNITATVSYHLTIFVKMSGDTLKTPVTTDTFMGTFRGLRGQIGGQRRDRGQKEGHLSYDGCVITVTVSYNYGDNAGTFGLIRGTMRGQPIQNWGHV